jgi:hypothetical protein
MDEAPIGVAVILGIVLLIGVLVVAVWWIICGWGAEGGTRAGRFVIVWAVFALAWVLAFIRRVPQ